MKAKAATRVSISTRAKNELAAHKAELLVALNLILQIRIPIYNIQGEEKPEVCYRSGLLEDYESHSVMKI